MKRETKEKLEQLLTLLDDGPMWADIKETKMPHALKYEATSIPRMYSLVGELLQLPVEPEQMSHEELQELIADVHDIDVSDVVVFNRMDFGHVHKVHVEWPVHPTDTMLAVEFPAKNLEGKSLPHKLCNMMGKEKVAMLKAILTGQ